MRKKILMIGTSFETKGGISTVVNAYREHGLFEKNDITYLSTHCDGSGLKKTIITIKAVLCCLYYFLFASFSLVHIHLSSRASFFRKSLFIALCHLFKKPIILHLHGSEFEIFFDQELPPWLRTMALKVFNSPEVIITLSDQWNQWVSATVTSPEIVTIHNSINKPRLLEEVVRNQQQILFLGRIGTRKGAYDLIEAMVDVVAKYPDVILKMGGDGELEQAAMMAEEKGIAKNIEFVGWVRGEDKAKLLAESGIYILPSYNEGMPMSVLEALSVGLPVISTTIGGIPEQVTDQVEGLLVKPGDIKGIADSISTILSDQAVYDSMSAAAKLKFDGQFSADIILPQLESLYARALSRFDTQ